MFKKLKIFLNLLSLYFFLTGLFKLTKYSNDISENENLPKKYNKLILVVLDGLRYDAVVNSNNKGFYFNKMKFLYSVDKFLALSVSGLPTSTPIRLESILTGIPSNFLNGTTTFSKKVIKTDNLVKQIYKNTNAYFYGDDTWPSFFPEINTTPSDTIDAYTTSLDFGLEKQIIEKMKKDVNKYDVILSHFVFLDHFGHVFTLDDEKIQMILEEYDLMIKDIYEKMSEDTLLVVISDHGVNDDGSHGASSTKEMSAVAAFISKDKNLLQDSRDFEKLEETRNNYLKTRYGFDFEWIKTSDKINIIHQNDIMPTVCALTGIPFPYYTSGNLIYELIGDDTLFYRKLADKKLNVLNSKKNMESINSIDHLNLQELFDLNYELTKNIYVKFSGIDQIKLILSFFLIACSLISQIETIKKVSKKYFKHYILLFFVIIMVAHSVHSFIHEDLAWGLLYLINNFSIINFLILVFYYLVGKFPQHSQDRCIFIKEIHKADFHFQGNYTLIYLFTIFLVFKFMKSIRKNPNDMKRPLNFLKFLEKELTKSPYLLLIIFRYFAKNLSSDHTFRLLYLLNEKNIYTIVSFIFSPPDSLFILYLTNNFEQKRSNVCSLFSLVNMSLFYSGLNYALSSINYSVPFTFTNSLNYYLASALMLIYFLYPRISIILENRKCFNDTYFLILTFNYLIVQIVSLWFFDNMLFYFLFAGRCFFVSFYFIVENLLYLIMK